MHSEANVLKTGDVIELSVLKEVALKFFSQYSFQNAHEFNLQMIIYLSHLESDTRFPDFDFKALIKYMEMLDKAIESLEFK